MAKLLKMYTAIEVSANSRFSRGGDNELWSAYENAVAKAEAATGKSFASIHSAVKKAYADSTKRGSGSPGKAGMTMMRPD
jgi:hypothetical protein